MKWILVYVVAQTIGTAGFADKEACMGRVATLHEQKIEAKCVESPSQFSSTAITLCGTTVCR